METQLSIKGNDINFNGRKFDHVAADASLVRWMQLITLKDEGQINEKVKGNAIPVTGRGGP
jgi:hypothetical protein